MSKLGYNREQIREALRNAGFTQDEHGQWMKPNGKGSSMPLARANLLASKIKTTVRPLVEV